MVKKLKHSIFLGKFRQPTPRQPTQKQAATQNAQALELYMRCLPEATSYIDCFKQNESRAPQLEFEFVSAHPSARDCDEANACAAHLERLFKYTQEKIGINIDITSPQEQPQDDHDHNLAHHPHGDSDYGVALKFGIDLSNPKLKTVILELAEQVIKERENPPKTTPALGTYVLSQMNELKPLLGYDKEKTTSPTQR